MVSVPKKRLLAIVPRSNLSFLFGLTIIFALLPVFFRSFYLLHIFIQTFIFIIAAASLRAITITGLFPLAHAGFMGVGAYFSAIVTRNFGWPPLAVIPLAALVAAAIGILTGLPFARLRTLYYAMGSLFLGIGLMSIISSGGTLTGGYSGLAGIKTLFPLGTSKICYYYFFLALTLVCLLALYRFEFSRIGTILNAISQSHIVASSVGINESWYKIVAMGVGYFFAGLAGAAYAHYEMVISPSSFDFMATLWLSMYVLIGGINSFWGPIIGTALLFLIPELARDLKMYTPFVSAIMLAIVAYLLPDGLADLSRFGKRWRENFAKRNQHEYDS